MNNPYFYASGARPDDPFRALIFFDGFTSERSRTIEPSAVDGGRYYETFASCMRVYRLQVRQLTSNSGYCTHELQQQKSIRTPPPHLPASQAALGIVSDGVSCDVAGEECCEITADEVCV